MIEGDDNVQDDFDLEAEIADEDLEFLSDEEDGEYWEYTDEYPEES